MYELSKVSEILRKNAKGKSSILCPFSKNCDVTNTVQAIRNITFTNSREFV